MTINMSDIPTRLLRAEDELLSAISNDSFEEFQREWSKLHDDVAAASRMDQLPASVQMLAHTVANRLYIIVTGFFSLDVEYRVRAGPLALDARALGKEHSHEGPVTPGSTLPSHISLAYEWLLNNLHCPYPSTSTRQSLADRCGLERKVIDAWFVDARKRIGWNTLRKLRFGGKKDSIIRAATQFFLENRGDDATALDFGCMELTAKDLYAEKLRPSPLATRIAVDIDTFTSGETDRGVSVPGISTFPQLAAPSPQRSSTSSSPSPPSKRRRPIDDSDEVTEIAHRQSRKRQRFVLIPTDILLSYS